MCDHIFQTTSESIKINIFIKHDLQEFIVFTSDWHIVYQYITLLIPVINSCYDINKKALNFRH